MAELNPPRTKMMLGRAALAHLRSSFQQHGPIRNNLQTSKSSEQLSKQRVDNNNDVNVNVNVGSQSMSSRRSSNTRRQQSKSRRSSRTVSPSSRRSSSVSTNRRLSTSSAAIVDTDDDGVVLIGDHATGFIDTATKFDGNLTLSKFDLLHAVRYKLEHNEIGRASPAEKRRICSVLGDHLRCGDPDLVLYSAQARHPNLDEYPFFVSHFGLGLHRQQHLQNTLI